MEESLLHIYCCLETAARKPIYLYIVVITNFLSPHSDYLQAQA